MKWLAGGPVRGGWHLIHVRSGTWPAVVLAIAFVAGACSGSTPATPVVGASGTAVVAPPATESAAPSAAGPGEVAGPATQTPSPASPSQAYPSPTAANVLPAFKHIYVIILENQEYGSIVGASAAPYLNSLMARYGLTTNFYAETHPSEPNYIALTSGGLQGTNSDGTYNLAVPNLFDQIEASGRSWHTYAQGYPGGCFKPYISPAVVDGTGAAGDYVRKHNPAISYTAISGDPIRCANITRLSGFDPAAADFEMIIPNEINDMHSSSVAAGDSFLKAFVPQIVDSAAFAGSVVFITWDEGDTNLHGGGHIATLALSPRMPPGTRFTGPCTHYSILRTIEEAWGLPLLGEAGNASTIALPY
jgi:phosphatidylinositol-3-phosphatase